MSSRFRVGLTVLFLAIVAGSFSAVGRQNAIRIWTVDGMRYMDQP
jgi:hypothetical protein